MRSDWWSDRISLALWVATGSGRLIAILKTVLSCWPLYNVNIHDIFTTLYLINVYVDINIFPNHTNIKIILRRSLVIKKFNLFIIFRPTILSGLSVGSFFTAQMSVCLLSVYPSISYTRAMWQNKRTYRRYFDTVSIWKGNHSFLWHRQQLTGDVPF